MRNFLLQTYILRINEFVSEHLQLSTYYETTVNNDFQIFIVNLYPG